MIRIERVILTKDPCKMNRVLTERGAWLHPLGSESFYFVPPEGSMIVTLGDFYIAQGLGEIMGGVDPVKEPGVKNFWLDRKAEMGNKWCDALEEGFKVMQAEFEASKKRFKEECDAEVKRIEEECADRVQECMDSMMDENLRLEEVIEAIMEEKGELVDELSHVVQAAQQRIDSLEKRVIELEVKYGYGEGWDC